MTQAPALTSREQLVDELARNVTHAPDPVGEPPSDAALAQLGRLGTRIWLDTGNLDEAAPLWRREMSALTTNNTLANQVVQTGLMDDVIATSAQRIRGVEPGIAVDELVMDVVFIVNCHIALRLVRAFDAMVSVELHPAVAHDMAATLRYAHRYIAIRPDRFIVKIPLTPEGYCAVARARAAGIPINYTLGFSARQNHLAARLSRPSFVNVFLGRLNAVVADNHLGDGINVGEKAALASQRAVAASRRDHGTGTLQIAASIRSGEQLATLAGMDVYTAPPKAVAEFFAQAHAPESLRSHVAEDPAVESSDNDYLGTLWNIDPAFERLVNELEARGGTNLTGDDLRSADRDLGTGLFSGFTEAEKAAIRADGKIPVISKWRQRAKLDDLMTESAMQSFITDQAKFDDRIRGLL